MGDRRALAALLSEMARDPAKVDAFRADPEGVLAKLDLEDEDRAVLLGGDDHAIHDRFCTVRMCAGKPLVVGTGGFRWDGGTPAKVMPMGLSDLTVVGTGYVLDGQLTPQAESVVRAADEVLCVVDELTFCILDKIGKRVESMIDLYEVGRQRFAIYDQMVARVMERLRSGRRVALVLYGHPGVFATPGHGAIRRAREEGFSARMLPAVSAEAALFADLGYDPAMDGCQSYEATDFLLHKRRIDVHAALILWQIGTIGVSTFEKGVLWSPKGLVILAAVLTELYSEDHRVILYRASENPLCPPDVRFLPVRELGAESASLFQTLFVPPIGPPPVDPVMAAYFGIGSESVED